METIRFRSFFTAMVPALAIGLTACGASKTPFDPAVLSQSTDDVITAMDSSQVQQSMDVMGSKMTAGAPTMSGATEVAALPRIALTGGFAAWATQRLQAAEAGASSLPVAAPAAVIPDSVRGVTFTYNADAGAYQAGDLTGAPANGVRFILYAVNPVTHNIVTPLTQIGYADILDESSGSTNKVHLKAYVTGNSTPLIDYTASATVTLTNGNPSGGTATATGYVSDGTTQVDFDLTQTFSTTTGLSVDYKLSVAEKDVSIEFKASITLLQVASITITVKAGGNADVITASGTQDGPITGDIKHNGTVVINIGGTSANPTFTDASGNPVTGEQAQALRRVAFFISAVLLHVDGLLAPAHALFLLPF